MSQPMKGYASSQFKALGNLPPQSAYCGGCAKPGQGQPCDAFVGSYVPPKFLTRSSLPQYHSGYPTPMSGGFTRKAPAPAGVLAPGQTMPMGQMAQESAGSDFGGLDMYGPCVSGNCSRGVNSAQLYDGPQASCEGCGFDDVYVDSCRDVGYSDMLHSDYTNVLSTTHNSVYDPRGPVDCDSSSCGGCPQKNFEGLYGKNSARNEDNWLFTMPTRTMFSVADNKSVRTFGY